MKKKVLLASLPNISGKEKSTLKNEIKTATDQVSDNEYIKAYCTMAKLMSEPNLLIMTGGRFLHFSQKRFKQTGVNTYQLDNIHTPFVIHRNTTVDLTFQYERQTKRFSFPNDDKNLRNIRIMAKELNAQELQFDDNQKDVSAVKQKLTILFEDGHQELGLALPYVDMIQLENNKVYFKEGKNVTEYFTFHAFDRAENLQRSSFQSLGYALLGNVAFGTAGAIGMAAASTKGIDKSKAVLFLTNDLTGVKQAAVIDCDAKTFSKLSKFTASPEEMQEAQEESTDKYAEVERIHALKEKGILSEEEFEAEKAKLLK